MAELTIPVYARLGTDECQIGSLVSEDGHTKLLLDAEKVRLARGFFAGLMDGES